MAPPLERLGERSLSQSTALPDRIESCSIPMRLPDWVFIDWFRHLFRVRLVFPFAVI
jgi:hypothetical protein